MKIVSCRIVSLALILAHVAGCTGSLPPPPQKPPPLPSETQRSQFGKVGVISIKTPPEATLDAPVIGRGKGAALGGASGGGRGALEGARIALGGSCSGSMCAAAILLVPAFMVVGAIVGGITGGIIDAADAIPSDTAKQIEQQIKKTLLEAKPQARLLRGVMDAAQQEGISAVRQFSGSGPQLPDQNPDYGNFQNEGIDAVLEVGVIKVGLFGRKGDGGADPLLYLVLQASVRLVNTKTNADIYSRRNISPMRPPRNFSEWGSNEAALLREELNNLFADTSQTIVEDVFLIVR